MIMLRMMMIVWRVDEGGVGLSMIGEVRINWSIS